MTHETATTSRPRSPSRALRLAALAGCLATLTWGTASAQHRLEAVDECMETSTDLVGLPSTPAGTLDARSCTTCDRVYLTFEAGTQFFVGKQAVSYTHLLAAARNGQHLMVVCYRPGANTLTAVRLQ